ncbi:hypothetical protein [Rhizobium sp. BT03]|nr:hypothetical protein [Rhizobium sp. BT03]WHO73052.1 hypothetical protein QMO80_002084 [Rhizobium sp. BT03]
MLFIVSLSLAAAAPTIGRQIDRKILHLPVRQLMPLLEWFKPN